MIECIDLTKKISGTTVIDKINLKIDKGVTALVGVNGVGKSTLINLLSGRVRSTSGTVFLYNRPIEESITRIGMVYEEVNFYPYMTAEENLKYLCAYQKADNIIVKQMMEKWEVCKDKNKPVSAYSLGMKKRLCFAACELNQPDIILMDEPLNGLDIGGQKLVEEFFAEKRKEGKIILFSSHQIEKITRVADYIIILDKGKIFYEGSVLNLCDDNKNVLMRVNKAHIKIINDFEIFKNISIEGEFLTCMFPVEKMKEVLSMILENSIMIYQMESLLPSLEEILYSTKEE